MLSTATGASYGPQWIPHDRNTTSIFKCFFHYETPATLSQHACDTKDTVGFGWGAFLLAVFSYRRSGAGDVSKDVWQLTQLRLFHNRIEPACLPQQRRRNCEIATKIAPCETVLFSTSYQKRNQISLLTFMCFGRSTFHICGHLSCTMDAPVDTPTLNCSARSCIDVADDRYLNKNKTLLCTSMSGSRETSNEFAI